MSLNILIINQNEEICNLLSRFLISEGHTPLCVPGTADAVQEVVNHRPDLIIIEVAMPELMAIEIVNRLHRSAQLKQIPVIVISDFADLEFELLHLFDFICKPVDLIRLREDIETLAQGKKRRLVSPQTPHLTPEEHQKFHDYLLAYSGLHFERRNIKMLERGLESRMAALRIGSYADYYEYLSANMERRQELQKLLQFLTVGETFFFRYNAHFSALMQTVLPEIAARGAGSSIRLWSAGCSTGEEPYSMAMAIMETIPDWRSRDIRILATDINNRSLMRAREGVYGPWKVRVTEQRYLDRYFRRIGESYVVKDEVKKLVEFTHLNLQTAGNSPHPLLAEGVDAIFCRNVMIYFTTPTTRRVVESFAGTLKPGGYLFLGHSETLSHISTRFERRLHDGGFYYRKKLLSPLSAPVAPAHLSAPPAHLPPAVPQPAVAKAVQRPAVVTTTAADADALHAKAVALVEDECFSEADDLFRQVLEENPAHTGAILGISLLHANGGRFEQALEECNRALQLDDLLPEAYFLRGLVYEMLDREADSCQEYRKAILLKMDFVMPHYQLGKLYFRTGQQKDGLRELRNSLKLLEKTRRETIIPYSGGLSREVFLEQLREELLRVDAALAA
jgi:chemotaxis protein methyltransferase CheR